MKDKIDRIIELLEEINNKLDDNKSVMDKDAIQFIAELDIDDRLFNAVASYNMGADTDMTVGKLYGIGEKLRNVGSVSMRKFREEVDKRR